MKTLIFFSLGISSLAGLCLPGPAQQATSKENAAANLFLLKLKDQEIGTASWTQTAQQVHSRLQFKLPNVAEIEAEQTAAYDAQTRFTGASLTTKVNGNPQPRVTIVVDADGKKATFRATMGSDSADLSTVELHSHAVMLNDFDPSGVEMLLQMFKDGKDPMSFQALIAKGKGIAVNGAVRSVGEDTGKLQDHPIPLRHSLLSLAGADMDVWSDLNHHLMRASVASQSVEYVRQGFALESSLPAGINETEIKFKTKDIELPGTITAPSIQKPIAVVVMVHGSGPQDRDETIAANKPFRDLAYGLAQHGIASLRYDKRTRVAPQTWLSTPTLDREVNDDAVAAIAFVHAKPELKDLPIFILGHSLGASMAPFIVAKAKAADLPIQGEIMMASTGRPIDQVILEQIRTLTPEKDRAAALKQANLGFANIRDPKTGNGESVSGVPVGYWRDWLAHDTVAELKKVNIPTLILQGDKDFQVSRQDYDLLMAAAKPSLATGKLFPGLNHLFMPAHVVGLQDYQTPAHVSEEVITTISNWITTTTHATATPTH